MLYTNLKHLESAAEHREAINNNENVMVCCGRMGPMCIPVYGVMEELENEYTHVKFYDMDFDNPDAHVIYGSSFYCLLQKRKSCKGNYKYPDHRPDKRNSR
jgi:hypothetical protein